MYDRFQFLIQFSFFYLFSILSARFKDPFILKKIGSKNIEHLLPNAFCVSRIHELGEIYIYTHPRWKINLHTREESSKARWPIVIFDNGTKCIRDARGRVRKAFSLVNIFTWKNHGESGVAILSLFYSPLTIVDLRLADCQIFFDGGW